MKYVWKFNKNYNFKSIKLTIRHLWPPVVLDVIDTIDHVRKVDEGRKLDSNL